MDKKIKIFHFPFSDPNSGITHYVMNNWKYINKDKFEFTFGIIGNHPEFENQIINSGARAKIISCKAEENRKKFEDEIRSILLERYDVVHLHTSFWRDFHVERLALEAKVPKIIVHSHSTKVDLANEEIRKKAEIIHETKKQEFNASLATDFCACSNLAADWLFGEQIPRDRIKIMKNTIDVNKFVFDDNVRKKIRKEFKLEDCFVIGHVGRFSYQKNHEFLIDVFSKCVKVNNKLRLVFVGNGSFEFEMKQKIIKLGLEDKVIFTGARCDVNCLLQAFDLFCLPSRFEGLGMVLVEAQAAGLKCLASDVLPKEVCITKNIDLLPLEFELWCENILRIVKEKYQRENMYNQISKAGYNIKDQIKEVEDLYFA